MYMYVWIGFTCLKIIEPQHVNSLLLTTKSPKIPGTHLINPWGWKCQPNLEPSSGFETGGGSKSDSIFDDTLMCSNSIRSGYVVSECGEDIPLRCSRSSPTGVFHKKLFWCRNSTGKQLQWISFLPELIRMLAMKNILCETYFLTKNKIEFYKNKRSLTFLRNPPHKDLPLYLTDTWLPKEKLLVLTQQSFWGH